MSDDVAQWDVWWTVFDPQVGRKQAGLRPAVVVGTRFACSLPNGLVFVVPCTTNDRGLPFHPPIGGLAKPTFAMCDQLKSISRSRLVRRHSGELADSEVETIKFVLRQMIETR